MIMTCMRRYWIRYVSDFRNCVYEKDYIFVFCVTGIFVVPAVVFMFSRGLQVRHGTQRTVFVRS